MGKGGLLLLLLLLLVLPERGGGIKTVRHEVRHEMHDKNQEGRNGGGYMAGTGRMRRKMEGRGG